MSILLFLLGLLDTISALIIILNLGENIAYIIIATALLIKGVWSLASAF